MIENMIFLSFYSNMPDPFSSCILYEYNKAQLLYLIVGMALSDSCKINPSYRGLWALIATPKSENSFAKYFGHDDKMTKHIMISETTVSFTNTIGGENTFYEFNCLREASEIIPDWYILGGRQLQPGW